jgi:hypothetical protein
MTVMLQGESARLNVTPTVPIGVVTGPGQFPIFRLIVQRFIVDDRGGGKTRARWVIQGHRHRHRAILIGEMLGLGAAPVG